MFLEYTKGKSKKFSQLSRDFGGIEGDYPHQICEIQIKRKENGRFETLKEAKRRFLQSVLKCNDVMNALGGWAMDYELAKEMALKNNAKFKKKCENTTGKKYGYFAYPAWEDHEGNLSYDWNFLLVDKLLH